MLRDRAPGLPLCCGAGKRMRRNVGEGKLQVSLCVELVREFCRFLATKPRSGTDSAPLRSRRSISCRKSPGQQIQRGRHDIEVGLIRARTRFRGQKRSFFMHGTRMDIGDGRKKGLRGVCATSFLQWTHRMMRTETRRIGEPLSKLR